MIQRRIKMKKSVDKKIFSRTAKKTAKINIAGNRVPRGGIQLWLYMVLKI